MSTRLFKQALAAFTALSIAFSPAWAGNRRGPIGGESPAVACAAILTKLATLKPGEALPLAFMKKYFNVEPALSNAFVLPASDATWAATRASMKLDLQRLSKELATYPDPQLYVKVAEYKQPPANFSFAEEAGSLNAKGMAYVEASDGRLFRIDIREALSRGKDGSMNHTLAVGVWELALNAAPRQVAYADGPHMADNHGRWFHAHDKATDAVVAQVATPAFEKSAVPAIIEWAKDYVSSGQK